MAQMVVVLGNVGNEPKIVDLENGNKLIELLIAVNENYFNSDGEKIESVEWFNFTFFGNICETFIEPHIKKGTKVYVEGKQKTRTWFDENNNKKYSKNYIGNKIELCKK